MIATSLLIHVGISATKNEELTALIPVLSGATPENAPLATMKGPSLPANVVRARELSSAAKKEQPISAARNASVF